MAGVFLSYDRDDSAAAKVIATALERSGHSVWWDLHVRGGAQFSKVIEEALKAADVVVVLWSAKSVDSAWVRDEASTGRDSGRLVPAALDKTLPPLGFRQFQTIDLGDWKRGAKSRGYKELEGAIQEIGPPSVTAGPVVEEVPRRRVSRRTGALVGVPMIIALAAGAYFLWPSSSAAVPTVTVISASSGTMAQELSRDLFAKLGTLQASNSDALQLVEPETGGTPDLIFKVDALSDASQSKATLLLLSGRNHGLLWSSDYQQAANKLSDLKQQLAYSAATVLDCASEAYGPAGRSLDDQTRRMYLKGCGDFTQVFGANLESLARTFREVTRRAPKFESAWARLLKVEDEFIFNPPLDTPAARAGLKADIATARKINPNIPEGYIGEADLASDKAIGERIRLLDLAVEKNPDNPVALTARSFGLAQVGRMEEALSDARRAVQIRPFSARTQEAYISALTYAGQFDAAKQEVAKAETLWPGASNLEEARFRLNLRYGPPQEALQQIAADESYRGLPGQDLFLPARLNPTPANVAKAVEAARKRLDGTATTTADYVQALAAFGRNEELLEFLLNWRRTDQLGFVDVIFRPAFRDFWRDQRSMQVAARFGLINYWRTSGHWPDFCSWPDLPYDCKKEAAKLHA